MKHSDLSIVVAGDKATEIEYLKEKLNIRDGEYFLINALTGENLDDVVKYLKDKYDNPK